LALALAESVQSLNKNKNFFFIDEGWDQDPESVAVVLKRCNPL
jgi:DNA repair exonuclease SbcCD ATPase subunit